MTQGSFGGGGFPAISHVEVALVSGETIKVQSDVEARWFNDSRRLYLEQTKFTETTDLRDLDRLLVMELMIFRWTQYLAAGQDYTGFDIEEDALRKNIREYSDQITKLKLSMGLTKSARDDAANDGNFAAWIEDLKSRAKVFGMHRENQLTRALTLMNELSGIVGGFDRSDKEEREKLGFQTEADIVAWVRNHMLPSFRELDEHFRKNEQRYWVRDM